MFSSRFWIFYVVEIDYKQIFDGQEGDWQEGKPPASFIQHFALGEEDFDLFHIATTDNHFGCIPFPTLDRFALVGHATHCAPADGVRLPGHQRHSLENKDNHQRSGLWMPSLRVYVIGQSHMAPDLFSSAGYHFFQARWFTVGFHDSTYHYENFTWTGTAFGMLCFICEHSFKFHGAQRDRGLSTRASTPFMASKPLFYHGALRFLRSRKSRGDNKVTIAQWTNQFDYIHGMMCTRSCNCNKY